LTKHVKVSASAWIRRTAQEVAEDIKEYSEACFEFPRPSRIRITKSELYDMIHPEISDIFTVRSVFIIDR